MTRPAVAGLLDRLSGTSEPLLTWYSVTGERIELSGPTLLRWVAKTAHLLLSDVDARPGERLVEDLGASWRAPAVWLAGWHLGLTLVTPGADGGDLAVTADGGDLAVTADGRDPVARGYGDVDVERLVVVAGPALALRAEHVPAGAVDYAATVSGFPDVPPPPGPAPDPALVSGREAVSLGTVLGGGDGRRLWLGPHADPREIVGTWARGGSVVWHDGLPEDEAARARENERAVTLPAES